MFGLEDWRQYIKEGGQYLNTAVNAARDRPEVFTPEILYNLTAMAIEKFLMGFLMYHGDMADNHTMADLLRSVERHIEVTPGFAGRLLVLDSFQEICDLDTYNIRKPTPEDIVMILAIGHEVKVFVAEHVVGPGKIAAGPAGLC
ncbi:MAG: hypothetical protein L3J03_03965 [Desulfobacterales bacterium]|nr:hypothetical protein [Desulfobacterales bacterium]